ncbi:hypothetical protein ACF0H5_017951 [Mactra antiquata]
MQELIVWTHISANGTELKLTDGFYLSKEVNENPDLRDRVRMKYFEDTDGYMFSITLTGVTHADNGVYNCSLKTGTEIISSAKLTLTVLNPVEKLTVEILDKNMETLAEKTTPIMDNEPAVEAVPGEYYVKCTAEGSNPSPDLSLFFNEARPSVNVLWTSDMTGPRIKNSGTFTKKIKVNALTTPQAIVCNANIPGNHYPMKQAGFKMMVQVDKPDMKCSNVTTRLGDNYAKVFCNISAEGESNAGLVCEKVSWLIGNANERLEYEQRWKDNTKKLDIIETKCSPGENGLSVSMNIFHVKPTHFVEVYYLVYGVGEDSHKLPIMLNEDTTAGVSAITASMSLLLCIVMATVAKRLVL